MALPSTRRPQLIEEELELESAIVKKEVLIKKISKPQAFMDRMVAWYFEELDEKAQRTLTPKKFKRAAISELFKLQYEYDRLPLDWVQQITDRTGMTLYEKSKIKRRKQYDDEIISVSVDPLSVAINNRASTTILKVGAEIETGEGSGSGIGINGGGDNVDGGKPKREFKKIMDLTNDPPPAWWLKAYCEGHHLPRELTVYSGDGVNVIFYDYEPKIQLEGDKSDKYKNYAPQVHDANSFNWYVPKVTHPLKPMDVSRISNKSLSSLNEYSYSTDDSLNMNNLFAPINSSTPANKGTGASATNNNN